MLVLVALRDVQPRAFGHQEPGDEQAGGHGLSEEHDRSGGTDEGREREVGG